MLPQGILINLIDSTYQTVTLAATVSLCVFTCFALSLPVVALYRIYLHPLSGIPGPRLAAVSNCWYAYQVRNGRMLCLGKNLHKQYGPVVRVGPNEVWFNTKDAFRLIYSNMHPLYFPSLVSPRMSIFTGLFSFRPHCRLREIRLLSWVILSPSPLPKEEFQSSISDIPIQLPQSC